MSPGVSRDTPAARQQRWRQKLKDQGYEQKNVVLSPAWIARHQQPGETLLQLVLRACDALDHLVSVSRDEATRQAGVSRDTVVSRDISSPVEWNVSRDELGEPVSRDAPTPRKETTTMIPVSRDRTAIIDWIIVAKDAMRLSYQKIADTLNAQGIPTFSGKGTWQKGNVERFYKGKAD
jgi:hypothetical protein